MAGAGLSTRMILQTSESRNQGVYPRYTKIGPSMNGDWTPEIQRLDHRCAENSPPRDKATGPSIPQTRTQGFVGFRTSRNSGLRGIQDFAAFRTLWDSRLRGIRDFLGSRTLQKTGTLYASDQDPVLWCSLREHKLSGSI